jgi:uncharacterized YigZ family protein
MLFTEAYKVIERKSEGLYKERGSKFLAYAYPIQTEKEVKVIIEQLKKVHTNAVHFCFAYRLGAEQTIYRMNDDGEPSGSAGRPIYNCILSHDLTNCLILVVRYFGGTLLGVPGLINAYKQAANNAIINNTIQEKFISYTYQVSYEYEDQNAVNKLLNDLHAFNLKYGFKERPMIQFDIKKSNIDLLEQQIKSIYRTHLQYLSIQ